MMTTTPNPSEEQIEKAARAFFREYHGEDIWPELRDDGELDTRSRALAATRVALTAAGVAPQEPSRVTDINGHSWMTWEESGKNGTYCRSCEGWAGKVGNRQCSPAPVLPSSAIDEEAIANLIHSTSVAHFGGLDPRVAPIIARAVAGWLKGQER